MDFDAEGRPLGFEVLHPFQNRQLASIAERFGFIAQYPAVLHAVAEAVRQRTGSETQSVITLDVTIGPVTAGAAAGR